MIYFVNTTDKLQLLTSAAASIDVQANYIEAVKITGALVDINRQNTNITTGTTTDVLAAPASSNGRTLKGMTIRNKDAALTCDVTVIYNANGTLCELHRATLTPGDCLEYVEGIGWVILTAGLLTSAVYASSDQAIGASVTALITGTAIPISLNRPIRIGSIFRWVINLSKTAAGVAGYQFDVRFGTTGTTADTSRISFTTGTQTAVADQGKVEIYAQVRGPIGAACIVTGQLEMSHNLAATGLDAVNTRVLNTTSAGFDCTTSGIIASVSMTTGAANATTIQQASGQALNI